MALVRFQDLASFGLSVCWFCTLYQEVFPWAIQFSPVQKKARFDSICIDSLISIYSVLNKCSNTRRLDIYTEFLSFPIPFYLGGLGIYASINNYFNSLKLACVGAFLKIDAPSKPPGSLPSVHYKIQTDQQCD